MRRRLAGVNTDRFTASVEYALRQRLHLFAHGVSRYQSFHRPCRKPDYAVAWQAGAACLRDYGAKNDNAPAVLIVPSLVNRCDILDLGCDRSFVEALRRDGFRPLLVDWGHPGAQEREYDLGDYILERLAPALDVAVQLNRSKPVLVAGYCMGGCLALALAQRRQTDVLGLALLATPWDFHVGDRRQVDLLEASLPLLEQTIHTLNELPVDLIQALFTGLDPWLTAKKFIRFAGLDPTDTDAHLFVALEDWLNDGVPLVSWVALACLRGWYVDNETAKGCWVVDGDAVRPEAVGCPTIAFIPARDHIVPPDSARALANAIPGCDTRIVPAGHIGMVAGSRAREILTAPLVGWMTATLAEQWHGPDPA